MGRKIKLLFLGLVVIELVLVILMFFGGVDVKILNPKGVVARQERDLMILSILIMLVVALPVYLSVFFTAFKYRDKNKTSKYSPDRKHHKAFELLWWIAPSAIVLVLAVITFGKTHDLDPYKPLDINAKPINIQVISLNWKWLFIYPDEGIATVNYVQFPLNTPVNFVLSSDGPMNSFWIPSLSGQIYTMTGMSTKIHIAADQIGEFEGSAAEINGKGFSGMRFLAKSSSLEDYYKWISNVRNSPRILDEKEYLRLQSPSQNNPVVYYSKVRDNLYNEVTEKYMDHNSLNLDHE